MQPQALFRGNMHHPIPPVRGSRPPNRGPPPHLIGSRLRGPPSFIHPPPLDMRLPPPMMMGRPPFTSPIWGPPRDRFRGRGQFQNNFQGVDRRSEIIRKDRSSERNIDINNFWVTGANKSEFARKDELLAAARTSQGKEDWGKYREQKDKCNKMYEAAEMEFIGKQETMPNRKGYEELKRGYEDSELVTKEKLNALFCDNCEKEFFSSVAYKIHLSEHKVCKIDGCTFMAHEKIIQKHVKMQHLTGLYNRIKNLNTPEDIKKWVEERQRKYPNRNVIQNKQPVKKNIIERKKNYVRKPKFRKQKCTKPLKKEENNPKSIVFPFKGTSELNATILKEEKWCYDDKEWTTPALNNSIKLNNALGDLIGAYMSDDESYTNCCYDLSDISQKHTSGSMTQDQQCLQTPEERKIEKNILPAECNTSITSLIKNTEKNTGHSKQNNKVSKAKKTCVYAKQKKKASFTRNIKFSHNNLKKRNNVLLEKLLMNEIRNERNVLFQCVRFIVTNNFLVDKKD